MEVQKEAQRIMTMSVWKMYHSRMQRGGLRLHRSLQLSLVMRNARDLYLSAKLEDDEEEEEGGEDASGRQLGLPGEAPPTPLEPLPPTPPTPFPAAAQQEGAPLPPPTPPPPPEPMETQEQPESGAPSPAGPWSPGAPPPARRTPPGPAKPSRKRRSCSLGKMGAGDEAGLAPRKKAKLADEEEEAGQRQPQRQEGPFPSLARVLQDRFSGLILPLPPPMPPPPPGKGAANAAAAAEEPAGSSCCRQGEGVLSITVRAVVAF